MSHNHYDHLDVSTVKELWKVHRPLILTPLANDTIIRGAGREIEVSARDWWEVAAAECGFNKIAARPFGAGSVWESSLST